MYILGMNSNEIQWRSKWAILVFDLFIASLLQLRFRMYIGNNNLIIQLRQISNKHMHSLRMDLLKYFVNIVDLMTHYLTLFNCTKLFLNGLSCCWHNRPQQQCQTNICINSEQIYWSVILTLLSSELLSSLKQTLLYSLWYIPFPQFSSKHKAR